ncbi:hypothetical protein Zm00014a_027680 [Zea mays]|uniref:ATP-dependent DNA helicase n=1 Tax=Zea mays TaxID=4577 RepID=A0A3L6EFS2_MAIZE|nr:hypothetical protein Zm00014a_027680 [Zea mays]
MGHNGGRTLFTDISNTGIKDSFLDNCGIIDFMNFATHDITGPVKNTSSAGNSIERKRQMDRERIATMSVEQRNKFNKKRRETRQQNKGQNVMPNVSGDGYKKENVDPDDDSDWLHRNEDNVATRDLRTPGRLSYQSSAQIEDVDSFDMSTKAVRRKHHVPRGERQAILACRNHQFEAYIVKNVSTSIGDNISDADINNNDEETDEDNEIDGTQDESIATDVPDRTTRFLIAISLSLPYTAASIAQGMMYHNIKSFSKEGGSDHKHLELYFYDDDPSLEHRYRKCREEQLQKDKEVIKQIVGILHGNPYFEHLRSMGHVENLDDYHIALNLDQTLDQKTYNMPLTSEVAAIWIEGSERRASSARVLCYMGRIGQATAFAHTTDATMHYCIHCSSLEVNLDGMQISQRLVYPWLKWMHIVRHIGQVMQMMKMWIRLGVFNPILHGNRLFQQFAVDTYIKIESSRLDFICKNRDRLRADLYQGLVDSMLDGDIRADKVGKQTVLSTLFIGGPRDMRRQYMDAMALDEKRRELLPGQTPQDRPDLVVKYKLTCPEQYDLLISAKIPSNKYPKLRKMVIMHMMHGPCGSLNPNCPCTKGRKSFKNHYPRPFSDTTLQGKDSYPVYRRRDDGRNEKVRGCELDNRWVVPYNPCLLRLFNYHINVEACGSIKVVKYLFKYIYKGHDRASVVMRDASKADDVDEIKQYRDARWMSPPEALWRIYGFELSQISPPVMQLQLHLPNMHMVAFHERQMVERVVNRPSVDRSMLTAYFQANRLHEEARGILYHDFPKWYTWQSGKGKSMGKDIKTFPLPPIMDAYDDAISTAREVYEEEIIEPVAGDVALKDSLNKEQRIAYDKILSVVDTDQGKLFFVDGLGGTGKTYLYRVLLAMLRS